MKYLTQFESPVGKLYITADDDGLTGIAFEHERGSVFPADLNGVEYSDNLPVFKDTKLWLSLYFFGSIPDFMPKLSLKGTEFCQQVWQIVQGIPYGRSMSYGEIARLVAGVRGTKPSPQAVGGAVSKNPVAIIVPCHRVLAVGNGVGGYNGGIERKKYLLNLEKIYFQERDV